MGFIRRLFGRPDPDIMLRLEAIHVERMKAQAEIDAKKQEFDLRKMELEAQYAEHLTKAKILESDARQERKIKAREYGVTGARVARARRQAEQALPECSVCKNPSSPALLASEIEWHHSGHPANFTPSLFS